MNFFEHQAEARRLSRQLIALFVVAVVVIVIAVDFIVVVSLALMQGSAEYQLLAPATGSAYGGAITITSLVVLSVITIASFYKANALRAGGAAVALSLGGERVHRNTTDLLHKRLLNVVEEMAIASGVPVPEVFVLEQEEAINAFTSGHTPANAAIAVTRGALNNLNRNELQAVIAHEFSHVLNGDMRINTRLIGLLFGILVIALAGRVVLRFASRGSSRKNGGAVAAILVAALALMVVGYVGLFFGRLIQAAVSRSRERLADASAVQFTRDPHGLRGALVKIGAVASGSRLQNADAEEVAHLLFASGTKRWFATHPPLAARIRAVDPSFQLSEFDQVRAALLASKPEVEAEDSQPTAREKLDKLVTGAIAITPAVLTQLTATPGAAQLAMAHTLRASLPKEIEQAGYDVMQATAMVLALSLDDDAALQAQQIKLIETQLGLVISARVTQSLIAVRALAVAQRQPALLHLLSALRSLDRHARTRLLVCLNGLLLRAGQMSVESYALRKLAQVHLHDAERAPPAIGHASLHGNEAELALLLSLLADAGHSDAQQARRAYESGMQWLLPRARPEYAATINWARPLDLALNKLDRLMPAAKELLLQAMAKTIAHDGVLTVREAELLRAICATLHCPVPPLAVAG
jgi:Zn-dependent protease with chaperone function